MFGRRTDSSMVRSTGARLFQLRRRRAQLPVVMLDAAVHERLGVREGLVEEMAAVVAQVLASALRS